MRYELQGLVSKELKSLKSEVCCGDYDELINILDDFDRCLKEVEQKVKNSSQDVRNIYRDVHNLAGSAGLMKLNHLSNVLQQKEHLIKHDQDINIYEIIITVRELFDLYVLIAKRNDT